MSYDYENVQSGEWFPVEYLNSNHMDDKVSQKTCDYFEEDAMKQLTNDPLNKRGCLQLWQFLLKLLTTSGNSSIIEWTKKSSSEFKLLDPEEVARLWGIQKNRPTMNYDKLSRSLRYYYEKGIMQKVSGERYVYKFINYHDLCMVANPCLDLNDSQEKKIRKSSQEVRKSKLKTVNGKSCSSSSSSRYNPYSKQSPMPQITINNLNYEIKNTHSYILTNPSIIENQSIYSQNLYNCKLNYPKIDISNESSERLSNTKNSSGYISEGYSYNYSFACPTSPESPKQSEKNPNLTSTPNYYNYYNQSQNPMYGYNSQFYAHADSPYNSKILSPDSIESSNLNSRINSYSENYYDYDSSYKNYQNCYHHYNNQNKTGYYGYNFDSFGNSISSPLSVSPSSISSNNSSLSNKNCYSYMPEKELSNNFY